MEFLFAERGEKFLSWQKSIKVDEIYIALPTATGVERKKYWKSAKKSNVY